MTMRRELPGGKWVEFHESPRRAYYLCDGDKRQRLTSVTTVLGVLDKPAVTRWSEAQGAAGVIHAIAAGLLDPATCVPDEAIDVVRANKLGADNAKQRAADRGLDVHGALEHWAQTGDMPPVSELRMDARPYLRGLARWLVAADPTPVETERIVCSPRLRVAGRYDLLCEIDGLTALCDLKTSRGGVPYESAHWQLRAYADCEFEVGEPAPAQVLAVGVSPDGEFSAVPCAVEPGEFEHVVAVYRRQQAIASATRNHRRAARKAAAS